jgi:hypothetical protein
MTCFSSLLAIPCDLDPDVRLSVYLGHHIDEIADWPMRREAMMDGLSRSVCDELVLARAMAACGEADMAATISETISTMVPLASSVAEVDAAIAALHAWYASLVEDGRFARVVEVKQFARDVDLLDQDVTAMDAETKAAWHASVAILQHHVDIGEVTVNLGGHDVIVTVETRGIDVFVQESPGSDDYLALYMLSYPGSGDGGGGWDGGPHGDEPEPDGWKGPRVRRLLDA